jgi:hypothetical protein
MTGRGKPEKASRMIAPNSKHFFPNQHSPDGKTGSLVVSGMDARKRTLQTPNPIFATLVQ